MSPVKLLFVDDDPDDRELIQEGLSALGAEAFLVLDSGQSLFDFLKNLKAVDLPEAIVLDLNMPQMGGFEILQHLKTNDLYQRIPVYILTTSASTDLKRQCIIEGAAGYYIKPGSLNELNVILNELYDTV
ncbi:MAG TPA: response regulator [Flavisolibacter sp.]|nr:response regulator [Flavisolibacter sp.]